VKLSAIHSNMLAGQVDLDHPRSMGGPVPLAQQGHAHSAAGDADDYSERLDSF